MRPSVCDFIINLTPWPVLFYWFFYFLSKKHLFFMLIVKQVNRRENLWKNRTHEKKVKFANSFASNNLLGCFRIKMQSSMRTGMWQPRSFSVAVPNIFVLENQPPNLEHHKDKHGDHELEMTSLFYSFMLFYKCNWWFRVYFALWLQSI